MKTFKGTDKNLKCRDFQYELGKEFVIDGKPIKCCDTGFHACENPLHVFKYYPPTNCRYFVTGSYGEIDKGGDYDSTIASSNIMLIQEIELNELIKRGINWLINIPNPNNIVVTNNKFAGTAIDIDVESVVISTGYNGITRNTGFESAAINTGFRGITINEGGLSVAANTGAESLAANFGFEGAAINTGYRSVATNTGDYGVALCTGYGSTSAVEGKDSFACGLGVNNQAKAGLGSWIALCEQKRDDMGEWHIINAKFGQIDGSILKANTFYVLKDGEFVEV